MHFSLPGQLRGPECRRVIGHAIALRRLLESWFAAQTNDQVDSFTIILRIDGSLGSFGPAGIENVELDGRKLSCDLVIADPDWDRLDEQQIRDLLKEEVIQATVYCFQLQGIIYHKQELAKILG
ncbi:MAG: hypothetical protein QM703_13415 [Gemmatales bacterium]